MNKVQIARVCHQVNKAYCESLGDFTQVDWEDAPAAIKASAIIGVENVIAHPDVTPQKMHQSWMDTKIDQGWVWGEVKDSVAKTHPCIVADYMELPESQRAKDYIFIGVAKALIAYGNE